LRNSGLLGTAQAESAYQVIDLAANTLQNVITFGSMEAAFVVDSYINVAGAQRVEFKFRGAELKLSSGRTWRLPPVGQGWFDTVYMDGKVRVAQDSRGDTLIVARDGPPRRFI
jgi:hypothetical protein